MKTQEKSWNKPIFPKSLNKLIDLDADKENPESGTKSVQDILGEIIRSTNEVLTGIFICISNFHDPKCDDFLSCFAIPTTKAMMNEDLIIKFRNIKSLLIGFMFCHCITNKKELTCYKNQWQEYSNTNGYDYLSLGDHKDAYDKFNKVNNIADLKNFNDYFSLIIHNLLLELASEVLASLNFTRTELSDHDSLNTCKEDLENVIEIFTRKLSLTKDKLPISNNS